MTAFSAHDAITDHFRLTRLARAYARALELAEKSLLTRYLNEEVLSLHDHKGDLTVTWKTKRGFADCHKFIETAWADEDEPNVTHEVRGKGIV